jgi:hypothetical protein
VAAEKYYHMNQGRRLRIVALIVISCSTTIQTKAARTATAPNDGWNTRSGGNNGNSSDGIDGKEIMAAVKAIETVYKGYRFRSRCEARWAVFFDHCGIKWKYEDEGYKLPPLPNMLHPVTSPLSASVPVAYYLPDFFMPDVEVYCEIKGGTPTKDELNLCLRLSHATEHTVIMLAGNPGPMGYEGLLFGRLGGQAAYGHSAVERFTFGLCRDCGKLVGIVINENHNEETDSGEWTIKCLIDAYAEWSPYCGTTSVTCERNSVEMPIKALIAARQARFEHGNSGNY